MHSAILPDIKTKLDRNPHLLLIIILKGRHEFYTNLDELNFNHSDEKCITLLIMNSHHVERTSKKIQNLFSYVVWFDGGKFWDGGSLAKLDTLAFPDIEFMIGKIVQFVNTQNLRIVSMEESFVRFSAAMREKYSIPGPKSEDADRFTSKIRMKIVARTQGIAMPNFQIISPAGLLRFDEYFESIRQVIGFPMILKPAHGVGASGVIKICNQDELHQWLLLNGTTYSTYLAEEYLEDAIELILLALVKRSSVQFFSPVLRFEKSPLLAITTGIPIAILPLASDQSDIIDKAHQFSKCIINSMMSSLNSLVVLRLYCPNSIGSDLKFSKISCRIPSPLSCVAFEQNCGLSPETVHILTQVEDVELSSLEKPSKFFGLISYPCRDGRFEGVPDLVPLKLTSEVKLIFRVQLGQLIQKAKDCNDICLLIYLWNENHTALCNDVSRLCHEFSPIIH